MVETSAAPGDQRVLVLSDSRAVLDVIERVWQRGEASLCKSRDRGAMIEAVCQARARLQQVVFAWCPGHRGIVPNEYADMTAKAHLDDPIDTDITARIADGVRTRDCLYEMGSDHEEGAWALADRRCFGLARKTMGRWVQDQLMASVKTLRYDAALADGKKHNYGQGGFCTEVVQDSAKGKKVAPKTGVRTMLDDCERVGFPMGRRARDSGLPHERGYLRRLEQEPPLNDEEAGDEHEWADEQRPRADARRRLTAVQREKRLGCPGCPRLVARACTGCGGWVGRPEGAAPACTHQDCPGASYSQGGVRVRRRNRSSAPGPTPPAAQATDPTRCEMRVAATRHVSVSWAIQTDGNIKLSIKPSPLLHVALKIRVIRTQQGREVTFKVPSAQVRREERKQDEDPQHSVRTLPGEGEVEAVGGGRCARTRQAQTTTERLRREGVRVHEDARFEIGPSRPLADLRHIVCECAGTPDRMRRVERLAYAVRELRDNTLPRREDTHEFHRLMQDACLALDSTARGTLTEEGWESLDCIFSAMVPDFAREGSHDERAVLVAAVIRTLQPVHTIAAGIIAAWKKAHDGEVRRRQDQERARGTMRTIMRAWREETDGRKAMSLRGAKDWNIERHAPCRMPTDCLPTLKRSSFKRKPDTEEKTSDKLWEETVVKEQKCEGGGGDYRKPARPCRQDHRPGSS